jgi:hypothetical protein
LGTPFDLQTADYLVKSASIGHGRDGDVFRCTLRPVSGDVLEALAGAVRCKRMIRFAFPQHPLVIESVELVQIEPGLVRIGGRVVQAA